MTLLALLSGIILHDNTNDVGAQFIYVHSWVFEQDFLEYHTGELTLLLMTSNFILHFLFFYSTVCKKLGEKGLFP